MPKKILQGAKGAEADLHCDTVVQICGVPPPPPPRVVLCGDDHAPVTRGRMRAQYPLPHGPRGNRPNRGEISRGGGYHSSL